MTEYLLSITGFILFSTILTNVLPAGKTSVLIKGIFRLCAYLSFLMPIAKFVENYTNSGEEIFTNYFEKSVIKTDEAFIEYCNEKRILEAEARIEKELKSEYLVDTDVTIVVFCEDNRLQIEKIIIDENDISTEQKEEIVQDFKDKYSVDIQFEKGG